MQRSNRSLERAYYWQVYKQLEALPVHLANPYAKAPDFQFGLDVVWRGFVSLLVDELTDPELQAEYLERCWAYKLTEPEAMGIGQTLQRVWTLLQ